MSDPIHSFPSLSQPPSAPPVQHPRSHSSTELTLISSSSSRAEPAALVSLWNHMGLQRLISILLLCGAAATQKTQQKTSQQLPKSSSKRANQVCQVPPFTHYHEVLHNDLISVHNVKITSEFSPGLLVLSTMGNCTGMSNMLQTMSTPN